MKLVEDTNVITQKKYVSLSNKEKLSYWRIKKNEFKLISKLDDDHLQSAFSYAQKSELIYHNKHSLFYELAEKIEHEAASRGFRLDDIDTDYHRKSRKLKSSIRIAKKPHP